MNRLNRAIHLLLVLVAVGAGYLYGKDHLNWAVASTLACIACIGSGLTVSDPLAMGENTKIQWAHHTFNAWRGCSKVSEGCRNCYAEKNMSVKMHGIKWGDSSERVPAALSTWQKPALWNAAARKKRIRERVFVNSLSDWLDPQVPLGWLCDLLLVISECQHLDFLLLTKRPEFWGIRLSRALEFAESPAYAALARVDEERRFDFVGWLKAWVFSGVAPDNAWLGVSCENHFYFAMRATLLKRIPAKIRFMSAEPLLGPIHMDPAINLDWVIAGGESGPHARPMDLDWARELQERCSDQGRAFFFKQVGGKGKDKGGELLDGIEYKEFPA